MAKATNEHEDLKRKALFDDDSDDEDLAAAKSKHLAIAKEKAGMARQCPYLDTIDRNVLDFGKFIFVWVKLEQFSAMNS